MNLNSINMSKLLILSMALLTTGCVNSTTIPDAPAGTANVIPAKSLSVKDLTTATKRSAPRAFSSDFHPLEDELINPSFRQLIVNRTRNSFKASGSGQNDLILSILKAEISSQSKKADSVIYLQMAAALTPRSYKCSADVQFQYGSNSNQKTFDHITTFPLSWGDASVADRQKFVLSCISTIHRKMNDYIKYTFQ